MTRGSFSKMEKILPPLAGLGPPAGSGATRGRGGAGGVHTDVRGAMEKVRWYLRIDMI
jgi:hypothetical protein